MDTPTSPVRAAARRVPREDRVASILQTARVVLRERGFEQFVTSEVARRLGVSEGIIYKYFSTKRELLQRVAEEWFEEFLTEDPPPNLDEPIRDRLFRVIWRNLWGIKKEPALTRFVLLEVRSSPDFRTTTTYQQNRRFSKTVMDVVEEGIRRGELRDDISLRVIRDIIFGAIEHQTWAFLRGEGDFSVDESASAIADVVTRGLMTTSAAQGEGDLSLLIGKLETVSKDVKESILKLSGK